LKRLIICLPLIICLGCSALPGPRGVLETFLPGTAGTVIKGIACSIASSVNLKTSEESEPINVGRIFTVANIGTIPPETLEFFRRSDLMAIICDPDIVPSFNVFVSIGNSGEIKHADSLSLHQNVTVRGSLVGDRLEAIAVNP